MEPGGPDANETRLDAGQDDATVVVADAATTDATSGPDSGARDAGIAYLGELGFLQDTTVGGDAGGGTGAYFQGQFYADPVAANGGCTTSGSGTCILYQCPVGANPSGTLSAGTLTLYGPPLPSSGSSVSKGAQGYNGYYAAPLVEGDVLGVSGAGADVAAFAEQQVTMPGMIMLTNPSPPADRLGTVTISTSQDLVATWTGGESGAQVFVIVTEAVIVSGNTYAAYCTFDAAGATGTIPQTMLATFTGIGGGYLQWGHERLVNFDAGGYPIQLSGYQYAYRPAIFQ